MILRALSGRLEAFDMCFWIPYSPDLCIMDGARTYILHSHCNDSSAAWSKYSVKSSVF
jgi:hypothetical protein